MKRRRRTHRSVLRKERTDLLRDMLIVHLGNICANWDRGCESPGDGLEIDHVDGITWEHESLNRYDRQVAYWRECLAGVRLQVLCHSCNSAKNQCAFGPLAGRELEEAPF